MPRTLSKAIFLKAMKCHEDILYGNGLLARRASHSFNLLAMQANGTTYDNDDK